VNQAVVGAGPTADGGRVIHNSGHVQDGMPGNVLMPSASMEIDETGTLCAGLVVHGLYWTMAQTA
jgi:hypothetical protein